MNIYHSGLRLRIAQLGPDFERRFATWAPERRAELLWQLHGIPENSEVIERLAKQDQSPEVKDLDLFSWSASIFAEKEITAVMTEYVAAEIDLEIIDLRSIWPLDLETIVASVIFTGQILWLERPVFAANNAPRTTLVMFVGSALVILPVALFHAGTPSNLWRVHQSGPVLGLIIILSVLCTLAAYYMMNRWQPEVTATQAGLIYCGEPVFTSLFALTLPAAFSQWASIHYVNETLTPHLVVGGGLILAANVMIILRSAR